MEQGIRSADGSYTSRNSLL